MEFYGSESTILTQAKLWSILLPKSHKTHIAQLHRSIFAIYIYIAKFPLIVYYHSLFYILGHVATIVTSYCDVRYMIVPK